MSTIAAPAPPVAPAPAAAAPSTGLGPIGLDIGSRAIRAVQLRLDRGLRIHSALDLPRLESGPITPREIHRLAGVLARRGFSGSRTVLGVPDDRLLSNSFEHPVQPAGAGGGAGGPPLEIMARVELARSAGCAPTQLEAAGWALPAPARARQSSHIFAVGCLHAEAEALLDAVESTGDLRIVAFEPRGCALRRSCQPLFADCQGICTLLDIGWAGAVAVLIYRGQIVYQRLIPDGGLQQVLAALTGSLRIPEDLAARLLLRAQDEDTPVSSPSARPGLAAGARRIIDEHILRLAREVGLSLSYASHWYAEPQIDLVILSGDGPAIPGAIPMLRTQLGAEVILADPTRMAADELGQAGPPGSTMAAALAAAAGLAAWNGA